VRLFFLDLDVVAVEVAVVVSAAFGVFHRLKVRDFDLFFGFLLFLCFVLHITFQLFVVSVVSVSVVSVAPNSN
jgi:hypothetical protein